MHNLIKETPPAMIQEREGGAIDVSVVAELQTYMGEVVKTLSWKQFTAVAGTNGVFDVVVDVQEYAVPYVGGKQHAKSIGDLAWQHPAMLLSRIISVAVDWHLIVEACCSRTQLFMHHCRHRDMNGMFVSIRAVAHDAQTGDAAFDGVRLPMRGPRVTLLTPPAVAKATPNANGMPFGFVFPIQRTHLTCRKQT
jgi:hypothetical protein